MKTDLVSSLLAVSRRCSLQAFIHAHIPTTIMLKLVTFLLTCSTYAQPPSKPSVASNIGLNTVQLIKKYHYPCETHQITTEDGYILTFHRIPNANNPPVFLMHGLPASSADFVNMGPNRSLAYILADRGYDVWLGNARGNLWSRNHTTLDIKTNAKEFFDFSFHEIGYYDLPAAIDYILNIRKTDSLYYIGYSQGGGAFLVMTSTKPEYNKNIKLASLLAPSAFGENFSNSFMLTLAKSVYDAEELLERMKIYEVPLTPMIRKYLPGYCSRSSSAENCRIIFNLIDRPDPEQLEDEILPVILSNAPSNAAMKQFYHVGQLYINDGFSFYDYGTKRNMQKYGTPTPPQYNLSEVTSPVAVYYGKNDGLVDFKDVQTLVRNLPNVVKDLLIPYPSFNHLDFMYGKNTKEFVFDELVKTMQQY